MIQRFLMLKGPVPFPGAYWVVENKLMAGFYPGSHHPHEATENLTNLIRCGVRCVINLMEETESARYSGPIVPYKEELIEIGKNESLNIIVHHFPIRDRDIPSPKTMLKILDAIDDSIGLEQPVYVHCLGGIGRTGTVVGCYLLRHGHTDRQNVFETLRILRVGTVHQFITSPETEIQRKFVQTWDEHPQG